MSEWDQVRLDEEMKRYNKAKKTQPEKRAVEELAKERKNRRSCKKNSFSPEEDAVILEAIKSDNLVTCEIARKLGRHRKSISNRVEKLKSTGTSRRRYKTFQINEDYKLIDTALKHLAQCGSLEATTILDPELETLAASLARTAKSTKNRWELKLKVWLLRYYKKTSNLEIRTMLANVIAENFDSIENIDWKMLTKYPEFSGNTETSLRAIFFSILLPHAARRMKIDQSDLTLRQIAEAAEAHYQHPTIFKNIEQRKKEVIEYFESAVNRMNIKDFV